MAFKVLNNQDEAWYQRKAQLLAAALRPPPPSSRRSGQQCTPPGACFKCNHIGHWAKHCPLPRPLPGHCPRCGQNGHWKDDCPSLSLQGRSVSHSYSQQSEGLRPLGPGGRRLMRPWDLSPLQDHFGGAQGSLQSSRKANLIPAGHRGQLFGAT
jgi:hypothetical protein